MGIKSIEDRNATLDIIVLGMQKYLIFRRVHNHLHLQFGYRVGDFNSHARWTADENTRTTAEGFGKLVDHLRDVRAEVISPPVITSTCVIISKPWCMYWRRHRLRCAESEVEI